MTERTKGTVFVANYHSAGIVFPRSSGERKNTLTPPLRLAPGTTTAIDAGEWSERKKSKLVQFYLDKGYLAEVPKSAEEVPVMATSTSEPLVPDHLKTDGELLEGSTGAKAKVTRSRAGSVKVQ